MANVNAVIAVDVQAALTRGDLGARRYMVGKTENMDAGNKTTHEPGDTIVRGCTTIAAGRSAQTHSNADTSVSDKFFHPTARARTPIMWASPLQAQGEAASDKCWKTLFPEGQKMTVDPFLIFT